MIVICEICTHTLGRTHPERLKQPMHGDMFWGLDPAFPDPFQPVEWEFLKCPVCGWRPFLAEDRVLTPEGVFVIGGAIPRKKTAADLRQEQIEREWAQAEEPEGFTCSVCGKAFKTQQALAAHSRVHK